MKSPAPAKYNKAMDKNRHLDRILAALFLLSVFLLALNKIDDTDTWMHLSLGKAIWEHKAIHFSEPYLYPEFGKPFGYSTWLFGLIYYLAERAFSLYGVILIKAATITAAFCVLLLDSLRPYRHYVISVLVLTAVVAMTRDRFVERPDTFLMLFLAFSIFSLNAYVRDNRKYLYLLPLMHILWVNLHSSVVVMVVPFLAYLAGGTAQRLFGRRLGISEDGPTARQLVTIAVVFGLSAAATLVTPEMFSHPLGGALSQYTAGAGVLRSGWWNQEIMELQAPTWETAKWPFVTTPLVALSFLLNRKRLSFADALLVVPFAVLQFTAIRFIFLFGIVAGPVLARNLSAFAGARSWGRYLAARGAWAAAAVSIVAYTGLAMAQVKPFGHRSKDFGFGINYIYLPEGALRYMDRRGIDGRVFNLFQWGGYILWRDYPKRTVFVDPRGQLTPDLLEKMQLALSQNSVFSQLEMKYGFDSCLVSYPPLSSDIKDLIALRPGSDLALSNPEWALVYWDDNSLVYLKKGGRYDAVIQKDEYRFVKPANGVYGLSLRLGEPDYAENVAKEVERNIKETGSARAYLLMGGLLSSEQRYDESIAMYKKALGSPVAASEVFDGLAYAYLMTGSYDESIRYCQRALENAEDGGALSVMGYAYFDKNEPGKAVKFLERALTMNPKWLDLYPVLIEAYKEAGMQEEAEGATGRYGKARRIIEGEGHFREGVRAYQSGKIDEATREFEKSIELNPDIAAAYSNLGYLYYDMGDYGLALRYQQKAVEVDPRYANAYYGLALICKKRGEPAAARQYWMDYLRIEPRGYYSRLAAAELGASQ